MTRRRLGVRILGALVAEVRAEGITFMAGSLAYNAFVSLLPLVLLFLLVLSTVGSASLEQGLIEFVEAVLTPGLSDVLMAELRRASASTGVSLFGVGLLIWGTLRIFRGLDTAFSVIYETTATNTFLDQVIDAVVVFGAVALAVAAGAIIESRTVLPGGVPGGWAVERVLLLGGLVVALFPMYYVFPDEDGMGWREAVPGSVFAAVGVAGVESLFGIYVELSSRSPTESGLASILVFLTWLYVNSLLLLVGAALNAVLSGRTVDVDLEPVVGEGPTSGTGETAGRIENTDLRRLGTAVSDADRVTVAAGTERYEFPAPDAVDTGSADGDRPQRLSFRWDGD
ncbi:MAG: YihY/virulence factor BrkB family protein [Salinirussus sp.]